MNVIKIYDVYDNRLDIFYRTNEKQLHHLNEPEEGVFIAESKLVIERALNAGYKPISFLIKDDEDYLYEDIFKRCNDSILYSVSEDIFNKLKGFILIKGILAVFKRKKEDNLEDILITSKRLLVLENVQNPTNIGAIFRNAAGLYCDAVILTDDSCDPLYRRSIRVSMGNVFNIRYCYVDHVNYLNILKEYKYKTVAFALRNDSVNIDDERLNNEDKLAIIMGSEGYGLSNNTINNADYVVKIDMNKDVDSLNVASASGIALYQLCKNNKK